MTRTASLRTFAWRHPEAGAAALAAGCWLAMLAVAAGGDGVRSLHDRGHAAAPVPAEALGWLLMAVAMMVPPSLPAARRLAHAALWRRRGRTVALFVCAHLSAWAAFGALVLPVVALLDARTALQGELLLTGALLLAAGWEVSPAKWRFVRACHLLEPVPPAGRRADRACLANGLRHGGRCVGACWPGMLAMAIAGHGHAGLMAVLAGAALVERGCVRSSRFARPVAAVLVAAAAAGLAA